MGLDVSSPGLGPSRGRLLLETCLQVKDQSCLGVITVTLFACISPGVLVLENRESTEIYK